MEKNQEISRWSGEFSHLPTEYLFLRTSLLSRNKNFRHIFLLIGLGFLFFTIPDIFNLSGEYKLIPILVLRGFYLGFSLILFFAFDSLSTSRHLFSLFTAYLITGVFISLLIAVFYGSAFDLGIHAFSAFLITFGIYHLLPLRIAVKTVIASFYAAGFLGIAFFWHEAPGVYVAGVLVYLLMINTFSLYTASGMQYLQRKEFLQRKNLELLAVTDPLTGIPNRLKFNEILEQLFQEARRYHRPFSAIIFDIDNFKGINDSAGHLTGDQILKQIAELVQSTKREPDFLARLGGDEFGLLLPSTHPGEGSTLCERLARIIEGYPFDPEIQVTCSFGVAGFAPHDADSTAILLRADRQLYLAKARGRNQVAADFSSLPERKEDFPQGL